MDGQLTRIGIMQGRLLPRVDGRIQAFPVERWPEEFALARSVGFGAIEFVFEGEPLRHPLLDTAGLRRIRAEIDRTGVAVDSVCADYFMEHPFHGVSASAHAASVEVLERLVRAARTVGVRIVVVPCVDASSLRSPLDHAVLRGVLTACLPTLEACGVRLALETDLPPKPFADLLDGLPAALVGVNYDMGNSASLGFGPADEFDAYGPRIVSVHVKDRIRNGGTVPLGTGDTDFGTCFTRLHALGYAGPIIIQGARGDDDVATAARYLAFVHDQLRAGE